MKFVRLVVVLVAVVAIGFAFALQQRNHAELRRELALLRGELKAIARQAGEQRASRDAPVAIIERQENERDELVKLREEISALRKGTQDLLKITRTAPEDGLVQPTPPAAAAGELIPTHALKNAGKATPEAAAETLLWAATAGDVDTLASGLVFTPSARLKADAWFAGLSESTRREYGSPEKVIALMIAKDAGKLGGMQILGQREIATDNVGVRLRFADVEGNTKDDNFLLRRGDGGWQLVLPDATVEKFGRQLAGRK